MRHAFKNHLVTTNTEKKKNACSKNGKKAGQIFAQKIKKPILQFDRNDNFIKKWACAADVSKILNIDASAISKCCRQERKTAGGFK